MTKRNGKADIVIIVILIAALFLISRSENSLPEVYDWGSAEDYLSEYAVAKENQQPLIIYFHVEWCGFCKKLNKNYLDNEEVISVLSNYRLLQIDPEKGKEHRRIADLYGVKGYPSFFVTHPHSGEKFKLHPFRKGGENWSLEKFLSKLEKAIESQS